MQWLKQWEKTEEGEAQKTTLFSNFHGHDEILIEFAKFIKKQVCGYVRESSIQEDADFMLSKLKLCNICYFEDYVKVFRKYYFLVNPPKNEYWL